MIDRGPASRPYVLDRPSPGVSRVRFSDPASRNALDLALVQHLRDDLSSITEGVVVIASTYAEAFSSGADVKMSNSKRAEVSRALYELYETILLSPCPVLAVVEGPAVGGGAQIALASDLRIAGPGARFRFPGIHHGIPIGMWALPAIVGRGRALDLCLTARWVDAPEAHRIGLVDRLDDLPMEVALRVAEDIAQAPSGAAARIKSSANAADILARLRAEAAASEDWSGALGDQA
jgi:enoyl-CoA hydratase